MTRWTENSKDGSIPRCYRRPAARRPQTRGAGGVALGGTVGGMDAADKRTWTYLPACPAKGYPTGPPALSGEPPHDELAVADAAHGEQVFADDLEPAPRIEPLRAEILRPHPDPQRRRPVA